MRPSHLSFRVFVSLFRRMSSDTLITISFSSRLCLSELHMISAEAVRWYRSSSQPLSLLRCTQSCHIRNFASSSTCSLLSILPQLSACNHCTLFFSQQSLMDRFVHSSKARPIIYALVRLVILGSLVGAAGYSAFSLATSSVNYPGGVAFQHLHVLAGMYNFTSRSHPRPAISPQNPRRCSGCHDRCLSFRSAEP